MTKYVSLQFHPGGESTHKRRSEIEVAVAIMSAVLEEEENNPEKPRKTRIQARSYVNWKAFKRYLEQLEMRGLVVQTGPRLTERGHKFLDEYNADVKQLLQGYGF